MAKNNNYQSDDCNESAVKESSESTLNVKKICQKGVENHSYKKAEVDIN